MTSFTLVSFQAAESSCLILTYAQMCQNLRPEFLAWFRQRYAQTAYASKLLPTSFFLILQISSTARIAYQALAEQHSLANQEIHQEYLLDKALPLMTSL